MLPSLNEGLSCHWKTYQQCESSSWRHSSQGSIFFLQFNKAFYILCFNSARVDQWWWTQLKMLWLEFGHCFSTCPNVCLSALSWCWKRVIVWLSTLFHRLTMYIFACGSEDLWRCALGSIIPLTAPDCLRSYIVQCRKWFQQPATFQYWRMIYDTNMYHPSTHLPPPPPIWHKTKKKK